jgi:pimeloyl-ACP methyl ester carboxylesterase
MPSKPKPRRQQARLDPHRGSNPPEMIDLVDPGWILKALAAVLGLALILGYGTLCILFSHAQWQLVLNPSRTVSVTPASIHLPYTEVHFGVDATGEPQLDGWFLPSQDAPSAPSDPTVLLLHSGDGSMADALPQALTLHNARLNVLLFDYRGYGRSGGQHPIQATMQADADTALKYLTTTRGISTASILVYGTGAGGALAVKLCSIHPEIPALILESPTGDFKTQAAHDPRARLVPVRLLFNQDFPLAAPLQSLTTPKLLISYTTGAAPADFQHAADPKTTVELPRRNDTPLQQAITRFLSAYVAHPAPTLKP